MNVKYVMASSYHHLRCGSEQAEPSTAMYPDLPDGRPHLGPGYVPYFYAAGRFLSYDLPRPHAPLEVRFVPASSYDFTSDLVRKTSLSCTADRRAGDPKRVPGDP